MINKSLDVLQIDDYPQDDNAIAFCHDYVYENYPKYLFGINEYSACISERLDVIGFIDEFIKNNEFRGKPVFHDLSVLPKQSMVVSSVILHPITVRNKLNKISIRNLDYFSFRKWSGLDLIQVQYHFSDDFTFDFNVNREKYEHIYNLLSDNESRFVMTKIINFRLSNDLNYMDGFKDDIYNQYFEEFLQLKLKDEIFLDIGSYDGFTSLEFIKRCPEYKYIHVFEPEPNNFKLVFNNLNKYQRINYHSYGLGKENTTLKLKSHGDASNITKKGDIDIQIKRLDDILKTSVTFMKMDIEGAEMDALEGAKQTILINHPRIAISVYHLVDDFWKIPMKILSIRDDYNIYMRHYTEGVVETVMYFIPK